MLRDPMKLCHESDSNGGMTVGDGADRQRPFRRRQRCLAKNSGDPSFASWASLPRLVNVQCAAARVRAHVRGRRIGRHRQEAT